MPDGTTRLTYSGQPYGQDAWWIFIGQDGTVVSREQGLQEKYFNMLTPGKSTEADVWALWGSARRSTNFRLSTNTRGCTDTRLRVDSTWPCGRSLMSTASCVRWK